MCLQNSKTYSYLLKCLLKFAFKYFGLKISNLFHTLNVLVVLNCKKIRVTLLFLLQNVKTHFLTRKKGLIFKVLIKNVLILESKEITQKMFLIQLWCEWKKFVCFRIAISVWKFRLESERMFFLITKFFVTN